MALLNQIETGEVVLPAIQRDFIWEEEKVEKLLDSIMRGYPIGIVLLWETYEDIQFRPFLKDYRPGQLHSYRDNSARRRMKLVLDGQQRLQSLFIGLFGTRDGKRLYFDVLSGEATDDVAEDRFIFNFLTAGDATEWNEWAVDQASLPEDERDADFPEYHFPVSDLFMMSPKQKKGLVRELTEKLDLSDEQNVRLDVNLSVISDVLSRGENILRVSTIDENLPGDSPERQTDADVLEIFVRINREGTPLSRSDLIFSMLKLNWKESAEALPEFVASINEGNSFEIDNDFVIRCLFAVTDLGTRLDLNVLRKKSNVQGLRANFSECCDAIRAAVDFAQRDCRCASAPLLGGVNTLVPFVYYLFNTQKHEIRNDQIENVRRALYLFAFAKPFSRYADSRIGSFIRGELRPRLSLGDEEFPIGPALYWVERWEKISTLEGLAQRNELLTLHLVQGLDGKKVQYKRNAPEIDHIFPRAELRKKAALEEQINHFANFWILAMGKNRNKSDRHPKEYFNDVSRRQLGDALIDARMLDYRRYPTFLKQRRAAILKKLEDRLDLTDADF